MSGRVRGEGREPIGEKNLAEGGAVSRLTGMRDDFGLPSWLSDIWYLHMDPKVGFVRWVWELILVRIVLIVMDLIV